MYFSYAQGAEPGYVIGLGKNSGQGLTLQLFELQRYFYDSF